MSLFTFGIRVESIYEMFHPISHQNNIQMKFSPREEKPLKWPKKPVKATAFRDDEVSRRCWCQINRITTIEKRKFMLEEMTWYRSRQWSFKQNWCLLPKGWCPKIMAEFNESVHSISLLIDQKYMCLTHWTSAWLKALWFQLLHTITLPFSFMTKWNNK